MSKTQQIADFVKSLNERGIRTIEYAGVYYSEFNFKISFVNKIENGSVQYFTWASDARHIIDKLFDSVNIESHEYRKRWDYEYCLYTNRIDFIEAAVEKHPDMVMAVFHTSIPWITEVEKLNGLSTSVKLVSKIKNGMPYRIELNEGPTRKLPRAQLIAAADYIEANMDTAFSKSIVYFDDWYVVNGKKKWKFTNNLRSHYLYNISLDVIDEDHILMLHMIAPDLIKKVYKKVEKKKNETDSSTSTN